MGILKKVITSRERINEAVVNKHTVFHKLMQEKGNCIIENMAAIPIFDSSDIVYILAICNKSDRELHSRFTVDELSLL